MNTVTAFKKRLKVGKSLHTVRHMKFDGRNEDGTPKWTDNDLGLRKLSVVQSNSFAFGMVYNGEIVDAWCDYPKASNVIFNDENSMTILEEQRNGEKIPVLTYTFID